VFNDNIYNHACDDTVTLQGIFMYDVAPDGARVSLDGVQIRRSATNTSCVGTYSGCPQPCWMASAPIVLLHECRKGLPFCYQVAQCCAAIFTDVSVEDTVDRPFMHVDAAGGPAGTDVTNAITGDISVKNSRFPANGCRTGGNGTIGVKIKCNKAAPAPTIVRAAVAG
jgi:hypothetical protein